MICPKCGAQLSDDARFCGSCGNTINAQQTAQTPNNEPVNNFNNFNNNNNSPAVAADSNKSGLIALGVIAVVAIVVVVFLFNLLFGSSWKNVIKDEIKFFNGRKTNVEKYYKVTSGDIFGTFRYDSNKQLAKLVDDDEWEDVVIEQIEDRYDYYDDNYGDDWKKSYEIKKKESLDKDDIKDIQDAWEDDVVDVLEETIEDLEDIEDPEYIHEDLDDDGLESLIEFYEKQLKKFEKMKVKKGYKVKVKYITEGEDDDSKDSTTLYIVKIDNKWTIVNGYKDDDGDMEYEFYFSSYPSLPQED